MKNKTDLTAQANRRINVIKGQLNGLMKMIVEDEYCIDILTQSSAIQNSLKSLDSIILERHLNTHVKHQFETHPDTAVKELLKVFKKKQRSE